LYLVLVSAALTAYQILDNLLNNNKPDLWYDQTHEIPFSRHIAKGISWSDISFIHSIHL